MHCLRVILPTVFVLALLLWHSPAACASPEVTERARKFLDAHTKKLRPLEIAASLAWWDANITGKDEDFKRKEEAQNKIDEALADRAAFAEVKELKEDAKDIDDPVLRRAIDVLYLTYLEKQVDPELLKKMVAKANAVEKTFNKFRATVDGKEMTDSAGPQGPQGIEGLGAAPGGLGGEQGGRRGGRSRPEGAGQAAQRGGPARSASRTITPCSSISTSRTATQLIKLFDELDELTREPFRAAKKEIDAQLAAQRGVKVEELMPWHYHDPFFQETPAVFKADLDEPFKNADLLEPVPRFLQGHRPADRPASSPSSDLNERKGKSPHAFCTDIDRDGDVRVLANIVPNELLDVHAAARVRPFGLQQTTTFRESLPYVLRLESHILTTEGVAMMFERLSKQRAWLEKMGVHDGRPGGLRRGRRQTLRYQLLIFSRWCQVMLRFEKGMYENPDQDLNKLWWDLVEKYQMVQRARRAARPRTTPARSTSSAPRSTTTTT